ncbi:hypothetical protein [Nocardia salmonicida]
MPASPSQVPYQLAVRCGSVNRAHTSSIGNPNDRVITRSRPSGVGTMSPVGMAMWGSPRLGRTDHA